MTIDKPGNLSEPHPATYEMGLREPLSGRWVGINWENAETEPSLGPPLANPHGIRTHHGPDVALVCPVVPQAAALPPWPLPSSHSSLRPGGGRQWDGLQDLELCPKEHSFILRVGDLLHL